MITACNNWIEIMRKATLLTIFFTFFLAPFFAQEVEPETSVPGVPPDADIMLQPYVFIPDLSGVWDMELIFSRNTDGLFISPTAPYSYPYLGFTSLNFIDPQVLILTYLGEEHRAFYDLEAADADNIIMRLTFKDGRTMDIYLINEGSTTVYPYYYRIEDGFFPSPDPTRVDGEAAFDEFLAVEPGEMGADAMGMDNTPPGAQPEQPVENMNAQEMTAEESMDEAAPEEPPLYSEFSGFLRFVEMEPEPDVSTEQENNSIFPLFNPLADPSGGR